MRRRSGPRCDASARGGVREGDAPGRPAAGEAGRTGLGGEAGWYIDGLVGELCINKLIGPPSTGLSISGRGLPPQPGSGGARPGAGAPIDVSISIKAGSPPQPGSGGARPHRPGHPWRGILMGRPSVCPSIRGRDPPRRRSTQPTRAPPGAPPRWIDGSTHQFVRAGPAGALPPSTY